MLVDAESMRVKIIDFGSSKLLSPGELQHGLAGTPEFMAPEVFSYEAISTQTGQGIEEVKKENSVVFSLSSQINGLWA